MVDQILQMSLPYSENAKQQNNIVSQNASSYFPKKNSFDVKDKDLHKDISFSNYLFKC